jgi:PAS domain S-box-containing protein
VEPELQTDRVPGPWSASEHFVHFYDDDAGVVDAVAHFVGGALSEGGPAVIVASEAHREALAVRLWTDGHDLEALQRTRRLVTLDAAQTVAKFLVDGWPDARRFQDVLGGVIESAAMGTKTPVRVFGEMVALLWAEGRRDAALRVEKLWNDLGRRQSIALFCAYPSSAFARETDRRRHAEVCAEHRHVIPAGGGAGQAPPTEHLRLVLEVQEKTLALDEEITRRREVEEVLRRRERELVEVLDNMRDGLLDVDADGNVRWANRAHLAFLGCTLEDHVGRPVGDFVSPPGAFDDVWVQLARGKPVRDVPAVLRRPDGAAVPVRIHSAVLRLVGKSLQMRVFLRAESPRPETSSRAAVRA